MLKFRQCLITMVAIVCCGCSSDTPLRAQTPDGMTMNITIDGKTLPVTLVSNDATATLLAALKESPITYEADDYGGFEKVGSLGRSLPTSNQQITTKAGDVILYSGNQIVLFYGSNSWSYTRLGRIEYESLDELKSFLKAGEGHVSVTLSISSPTGISTKSVGSSRSGDYISLNGIRTKTPGRGIYIKDGKKIVR